MTRFITIAFAAFLILAQGCTKTTFVGATAVKAPSTDADAVARNADTPPVADHLEVTPAVATVALPDSVQFTASLVFSDATKLDVSDKSQWEVDKASVAVIDDASPTKGVLKSVAAGVATVTAHYQGLDATANLMVTDAPLIQFVVTPAEATIPSGLVQPFIATGLFADGTSVDLTKVSVWSSADESIAKVDANGVATGRAAGITKIKAVHDGKSADASLTVTAAMLVSLAVTPATATVASGLTQPFVATGTYTDGSTKVLSAVSAWSSDSAAIAVVDNQGVATGKAMGSTKIRATYQGKSGDATLTVTAPLLVSLAVIPAAANVDVGQTRALVAEGTYTDGSKKIVTSTVAWSSANPGLASVDNVNAASKGVVTGVADGTVVITASLSGKSASSTITVIYVPKPYSTSMAIQTSMNMGTVWTVTSNGVAKRIRLDAAAGYPVEATWSGLGGGGHRTFVSEVGLLVGTTGGTIYRVSDDQAGTAQQVLALPSPDLATRVCMTSFKIGDKPYIGAAYTKNVSGALVRTFVRMPIDKSLPLKIDVSKAEYFTPAGYGAGYWGYSCFTDQGRGLFWSKHSHPVGGVDLVTGNAVSVSSAPNASWGANSGIPGFTFAGSYAMSGSVNGDLMMEGTAYTMAHEPISNTIFTSYRNSVLAVVTYACAADKTKCDANSRRTFDLTAEGLGQLGPISSLNDGRVVGMSRTNYNVYLFELVDRRDLTKGVKVTLIHSLVNADPYMYTDFTGATAYAPTQQKLFELPAIAGFDSGKTISNMALTWQSDAGVGDAWVGLKLGARCYMHDAAPPAFTDVTGLVAAAGTTFDISATVASCNGKFDRVELDIRPSGAIGRFSKTQSFTVSFKQ